MDSIDKSSNLFSHGGILVETVSIPKAKGMEKFTAPGKCSDKLLRLFDCTLDLVHRLTFLMVCAFLSF